MVENKEKGRKPDFSNDGVAVWINKDKNQKKYLSIKLVGHTAVNAFKNEPREEPKPKVEEQDMSKLD